jgi:hypothetical protein
LRKLLLDWSQAFDGAPAAAQWTAQWRAAQDLPALRSLAEAFVYGEDCQHWLQRGEDGWQAWLAARQYRTGALAGHAGSGLAGLSLLPHWLPTRWPTLADWLRPGGPVWQGKLARWAHWPAKRPTARLAAKHLRAHGCWRGCCNWRAG